MLHFVCFKLALDLPVEILICFHPGAGVTAACQILVCMQCLQRCRFWQQCCQNNNQCCVFPLTSWKWHQKGFWGHWLHWQTGPIVLNRI